MAGAGTGTDLAAALPLERVTGRADRSARRHEPWSPTPFTDGRPDHHDDHDGADRGGRHQRDHARGPDAATFWANIKSGRYSISDVPPERWDPELYYDPDPHAPDKTYSRIGGWVRDFPWEPLAWKLPIPPAVSAQMDDGQKWAVALHPRGAARRRLAGLDRGPRAGRVIIGNAIGGDKQHLQQPADPVPRVRPAKLSRRTVVRGAARTVRDAVLAEARDRVSRPVRGDHRGHDARRAGERPRRPGGRTCSTSVAPTSPPTRRAPPALAATSAAVRGLQARRLRRRRHRRRRPQHGCAGVRQVLQDRRAVGDGHPACSTPARTASSWARAPRSFVLKRLSDAERDGDRIYAVLLGARRFQRRSRQGHHRAQPRRAAAGGGARLAQRRRRPGVGHLHRGARHVDPRRATPRSWASLDRRVPQGRRRGPARSRSARSSPTSATSRARRGPPACSRR